MGGGGGPDLLSPQVSITEVKGFVLPLCFDQLLINSSVLVMDVVTRSLNLPWACQI